ncbi:MAG TPA: transglutaminase-like cysteine peptidase [Afifellaceae bacterium]|nr:transglutaminase-like cysteine peptidase [Afifellaceae bacterium]
MPGTLRRTAFVGAVTFLIAAIGLTDMGLAQVSAPDSAASAVDGPPRPVMPTAGWANPPIGYLSFCLAFPAECRRQGATDAVAITENLWTELIAVNRVINKRIEPVTDLEIYDTEEHWTLPADRGDCEDYVLLKRQALIRQGWPSGALLITVVFDEVGDGHAVLIARTDRGEFVLDNKVDAIRIWSETPYRYVKRQSVSDPDQWVAINDSRWPVGSTASAR